MHTYVLPPNLEVYGNRAHGRRILHIPYVSPPSSTFPHPSAAIFLMFSIFRILLSTLALTPVLGVTVAGFEDGGNTLVSAMMVCCRLHLLSLTVTFNLGF